MSNLMTVQQTLIDVNKVSSQSLLCPKYTVSFNRKKNIFSVKDGILIYKVMVYPVFTCQCFHDFTKGYCSHILYVLLNTLELSDTTISFLELFKAEFSELYKENKDIETGMQEVISKFANSEECGICLGKLFSKEIHQCIKCKQLTHMNCITKWNTKNKDAVCIYCKQSYT
jgi:hypothetical protein